MPQTTTDAPIGYLSNGQFHCTGCATDTHCPVYPVNIGIYSQQCARCKRLIVDGVKKSADNSPLNLFSEGI